MKWEEFIEIAGKLPVIDTDLFSAGETDPNPLKVQIMQNPMNPASDSDDCGHPCGSAKPRLN